MIRMTCLFLLAALCALPAAGQEVNAHEVRVRLRDGSEVTGELLGFETATYRVKTADGVRELRGSEVASLEFVSNAVPAGGWRASFDLAETPELAGGVPAGPYGFLDVEGRRFGRLPSFKKAGMRAFSKAMGGDVAKWADVVVHLGADLELTGVPQKRLAGSPPPLGNLALEPARVPSWTGRSGPIAVGERWRARSREGKEVLLYVRQAGAGKLVLDVTPAKPSIELQPPAPGAWRAVLAGEGQGLLGLLNLDARGIEALPPDLPRTADHDRLVLSYDGGLSVILAEDWALGGPGRGPCARLSEGEEAVVQLASRERYRLRTVKCLDGAVVLDVEPIGQPPFAELIAPSGQRTVMRYGVAHYEDGLVQLRLSPASPGSYLETALHPAAEVRGLLDLVRVGPEGELGPSPRSASLPPARGYLGRDDFQVAVWITRDVFLEQRYWAAIPYAQADRRQIERGQIEGGWSGAALAPEPGDSPSKPWKVGGPWALCSEGGATVRELERPLTGAPELGPRDRDYGHDGLAWVDLDFSFPDGTRLAGRLPVYVFTRAGRRDRTELTAAAVWLLGDAEPLDADERASLWPRPVGAQWALTQGPGKGYTCWTIPEEGALELSMGTDRNVLMPFGSDERGEVWMQQGTGAMNLGTLEPTSKTWTFDAGEEAGKPLEGTIVQTWVPGPYEVLGRTFPGHAVLDVKAKKAGKAQRMSARYVLVPGLGPVEIQFAAPGEGLDPTTLRLARSTLLGDPPLVTQPVRHALEGARVVREEASRRKRSPRVQLSYGQNRLALQVRDPQTGRPLAASVRYGQETAELDESGSEVFWLEAPPQDLEIVVEAEGYAPRTLVLTAE